MTFCIYINAVNKCNYFFTSFLRLLPVTSTNERFVKLAVVDDFWGIKLSLLLTLPYQNVNGRCKET